MTTIYRERRFTIPEEQRTGKLAPLRDTIEKMLWVDYYEEIFPDQDDQTNPETGDQRR